ncbi:MAG: Aspartate/tyrosine/aromatic aminotransferase [Bacillota bacterium]|nr:MAG: Aspartate/tyrosine/aromatic aminotransferase [Bacillota bacterium]
MVKKQAHKMENVPFSSIRKVFAEVDKLKAQGKDIISLGIGEPDFHTPRHITEALAEAARRGETHYTPNKGIAQLREAIVAKIRKDAGVEYDSEEIICTVGGTEGVYVALTSFLDPGDEVLVPDPAWLNYVHVPTMNGATAVSYQLRDESNFQIDVDAMRKLITEHTTMLVLIDPSNPTGGVQSYETLERVAQLAVEHDLLVVTDEMYEQLIFSGAKHTSIASFPGMRERTIMLNGFSKSYAMTGWRLGYIAAPLELIQVMTRTHMYTVTHTASMVQWAGLVALQGSQDCVCDMVAEFERRRNFMLEAVRNMKGFKCNKPDGAFYLFPEVSGTGMTGEELTKFLLTEAGVAVVPGTAFGAYGKYHIRISFATSFERLEKAAERMKSALNKL